MIKSISTQTGDFSYSLNLEFTGYGPFEFGWSGESKIFSFTGQSGRLYDNSSRDFYSYSRGESLTLSGNKTDSYNNYFINDILFNSNNSQNTGYVKNFFVNGPLASQITFKGNQPNYSVNSGVIKNGGTTGIINVSNNGVEEFKFYSGNFLGASGDLFSFRYPFDSGSITSFKNFGFNFSSSDGQTGKYPVTAEFYTNFGLITKNFNIFSIYELEAIFSLDGPSFINSTGNYDYRLDYDLTFGSEKSTDPYFLQLELRNISGIGDVLTPILFTGYPTSGSIDLVATGYINESGTLSSNFISEVSGFNTGLGYDTTGLHTGFLNSGFQWATGDFLKIVSIPATGQATGNLTGRFDISGAYDFSNTGLVNFTGQATGYLDTITGLTFSGNWDSYDNRVVEYVSPVVLISSGIEPPYAGASSPDVEYNFAFPVTGRATGQFKDSVILYRTDLQTRNVQFGYTGNVYDENPIVTGEAVFTDVSGIVNGIGETITGYGNYTGVASGITGNVVLDIQNQTNILSNYTGSITGVADFNFIAWTQFSSGEIEGSFPITTLGRYELTGQKTPLTGNYYTKIQTTTTNYDNYELNFIDSQNLTGYGYFTGDYTFSGTGFYVGDCSGVGYTGAGIVGFVGEENVRITEDMTGFFRDPQITGNFDFCLPLSGSRWFDNPLEISGNSGIALCYSHSDRVAETLSFSTNDSSRGDYTLNPFVLTYKWMDGATTFNDDVTFKFSPYYYASGTGVYEYKDGNALSAAITFYSGVFPLLDYKEIENFSFANQGWSENFNDYTENPFSFNQNTGDWKILITIDDGENVPPSGFFYMSWYDDSNSTQNNSPKVFNSYIGGETHGNQFVPTSNFTGFVPSIESGRPTGIMSHLKVLNDETNFISREGPENLQLLLTGTGYTSDIDVSGRRIYDLTGEFVGTSRSGFYFGEITGFQNGYVNIGLLDDAIFYYNYITGFRLGQSPTSLTAKNLFTGRVHAGYTVEQFSGDLADKVTGFGFDLFLDGATLNVSGDPASSTVFGFGLNSSSLSSSYNTYQNDFNTVGQVGVSATGVSSKELEFPTFIEANGIDGTFSGNAFSFSSSLDMTGFFAATGNNTGLASVSIPEGYNQTGISGSYFAPFSGFTGNIDVPSRNIFETLYNWTALTGENWTGFQNRTVYNTGNALSTGYYTGQVFSGNINVPFTGQITGTTTITGVDITILGGSGTFDLTGIVTGRSSSLDGFDFGFFDKIRDGVFIEQPSGSFSGVLTGTGYYEKEIAYNFQDTPFTYFSPSYIKTFTGEYEFYTGVSTGNLVEIPYDISDNIFKSGIYITGENTIFARIVNKKFFENDRDIIELFYSGESPKTGSVII